MIECRSYQMASGKELGSLIEYTYMQDMSLHDTVWVPQESLQFIKFRQTLFDKIFDWCFDFLLRVFSYKMFQGHNNVGHNTLNDAVRVQK